MNRIIRIFVCALILCPLLATGQPAPAGTHISIRLKTTVSSRTSKPSDPVTAVVIAPVTIDGQTVIAAGAIVQGKVQKATSSPGDSERAALLLRFTALQCEGVREPIAARVSEVDNARETVDRDGQVNGILPSETISGTLDAGLSKLKEEYSGLTDVLSAIKNAMFQAPTTDIVYEPGVEMTLELLEPLATMPRIKTAPAPRAIVDSAVLTELLARDPFQTVAVEPPKPSDVTNLLLIAKEEALRRALATAGWSQAAALGPQSKWETLRAVAEGHGYHEAPVSVLLLDGKPPDLVFEKANNTFAQRHHMRIWRRPGSFAGQQMWAVAATHDIGIDFSETEHTFVHRIDPKIDDERAKVVNDLLFAGKVAGFSLMDRTAVPRTGENATGDRLETDGRIAVLLLN